MRDGGGKQKGAVFEREICKDLSLWISKGQYEDVFWRSSISGGRATILQKKGRRADAQMGDITAIRPIGRRLLNHFVVEAKFYRDLMMWGLLKGDTKTGICAFWNKLKTDLFLDGRHPMLIARQNQQSPYVLLDEFGIKFFSLRASAHYPPLGAHFVWFDNFIAEAAVPPQKLNFRSQP